MKWIPSVLWENSFTRLYDLWEPLKMFLSDDFFLSNIVFKSLFIYFTWSNTYKLVLWSFQLIISILRHAHISKASNLFLSYFHNFQISDPYNAILKTIVTINFLFSYLLNLFEKALFSCGMHSSPFQSYSLSSLHKYYMIVLIFNTYRWLFSRLVS